MAEKGYKKSIKGRLFTYIHNLFNGGFFHILTGNFLNRAIAMISSIVVVGLVDKVTYADISYADNIFSYISLMSGLGMASALLKFCSTDQNTELDKAYIRFSLKIGGTFELSTCLIACICCTFLKIPYPGARVFLWALVLYPLLSYCVTTGSIYMRTQLDNKLYARVGLRQSFLVCVLSILFITLIGTEGIIFARYGAVLVSFLCVYNYYRKRTNGITPVVLTKEQKRKFVDVGLSLGISSFFSGIMPINESFLVNNIIRDPIITSNFRVAGLLPQLLLLISGAVTVYYFPIVARMTNPAEIRKKVINIAIVNGAIVLFLMIGGMILTPFMIQLLYGKQYLDAVSISYLLWVMRASNCVIRMVPINMLPAIGKTKFNLVMSIISCVLQCIIDYFFISNIGISGVAIGTIIVYSLSGVAYWVYFFKCCKKEKI